MKGFASRKFIVTMFGMAAAGVLAYFQRGGSEGVLMAGIASYNVANAWVGGKHAEFQNGGG